MVRKTFEVQATFAPVPSSSSARMAAPSTVALKEVIPLCGQNATGLDSAASHRLGRVSTPGPFNFHTPT